MLDIIHSLRAGLSGKLASLGLFFKAIPEMSKASFDVFWKWTIIVFLAGTLYAKVFVLAEDYASHKIAEDARAREVQEMNIRIGQLVEKMSATQASLEKIEHKLGIYEPAQNK